MSPLGRTVGRWLRDGLGSALRMLPGSSRRLGPPRRSVVDTEAWCAAAPERGDVRGHLQPLSPRRETVRVAVRHLDGAMARRFAGCGRGEIKPRFVVELPGARFWGRGYGSVIDRDDALHRDLSPTLSQRSDEAHETLRQPWLPRLQRRPGLVAAVGSPCCENFHHWLLDTVPKFGLLREAGWTWDEIDAFLLPVGADRRWHRETLARLGIPAEKIVATDAATHLATERLLVPSTSEPGREPERHDYTPEGLAFVRGLFLDGAVPRPGQPERILVSRERASSRRWTAGAAGASRLAQAGFVTVRLEEHSLREQAALFAGAREIVMPTGGGLANLAFCAPGTRVVELFDPGYLPTFSLVLSGALRLDYCALVGEGAGPRRAHADAGGARDIDVPVERVLAHLT